jgi:hypothetical protein
MKKNLMLFGLFLIESQMKVDLFFAVANQDFEAHNKLLYEILILFKKLDRNT